MTARLTLAVAFSLAVVLSAPVMGQIRAALRAAFPGRFVLIVGGAVAASLAVLLAAALARIREQRPRRYLTMAGALLAAAAYSVATRTGQPEVDIVERVHFVEYGLITFLFYRAFHAMGGVAACTLPVLAAFLVGTLDEWLQWFIPNRVGEARDVLLNLVAICCGLVFATAVAPLEPPGRGAASRWLRGLGAGAVLVFAAFVEAVHLGHDVRDERIGTFRSHYTRDELRAHSAERAARWRTNPPAVLKRFSREDQYMDEGLWHLQRRNSLSSEQNHAAAFRENLILEEYFAPVLDTPSYAVRSPSRWSAERRAEAARSASLGPSPYVSDAPPYAIVTWPRPLFWGIAGALFAAIALAGRRATSRPAP